MAKDYERRRSGRQKSSTSKQFFWLLTSFLCGYLTATIFDFTSLSNWVHKNILAKEPLPAAKITATEDSLPKPKFEFYTLLTKDHGSEVSRPALAMPAKPATPPQTASAEKTSIAMSSAQTHVSSAGTEGPNQSMHSPPAVMEAKSVTVINSSKESYVVQMASFKKRQEAERLKASLTLKGFDVAIVIAPPLQGGWFRVISGPYSSRMEAEKVQLAVARTQHIRGMVRKFDA
jgi:cell division protein FtsN